MSSKTRRHRSHLPDAEHREKKGLSHLQMREETPRLKTFPPIETRLRPPQGVPPPPPTS